MADIMVAKLTVLRESLRLLSAFESAYDNACKSTQKQSTPEADWCGDWSKSEWNGTDNFITTYQFEFNYGNDKYSIRAWHEGFSDDSGISFDLYKLSPARNGQPAKYEYVNEIHEAAGPGFFWPKEESKDSLAVLNYGLELATGIEVDICTDKSNFPWCFEKI